MQWPIKVLKLMNEGVGRNEIKESFETSFETLEVLEKSHK